MEDLRRPYTAKTDYPSDLPDMARRSMQQKVRQEARNLETAANDRTSSYFYDTDDGEPATIEQEFRMTAVIVAGSVICLLLLAVAIIIT